MRVNIEMENYMEKEQSNIKMANSIMVNLRMGWSMERGGFCGTNKTGIMESIGRERNMEKEYLWGIVPAMKVFSKMGKWMEKC